MLKPSSRIGSFLYSTRGVRHYGRKILYSLPSYTVDLPDGNRILIDPKDESHEWVVEEIYNEAPYERIFGMRPGDCIVDVGANIGVFTVKAAKLVGPSGSVIAIEPSKKNYAFLVANIALNGYRNILTGNWAASDEKGEALLFLDGVGWRSSLFQDKGAWPWKPRATERTKMDTLDSLMDSCRVQKLDILKIDVEGAEFRVLKGGATLINRFRPRIVLEWHPWAEPIHRVSEFLTSFHYHVITTENKEGLTLLYATPE